jgi:hypothetical protein
MVEGAFRQGSRGQKKAAVKAAPVERAAVILWRYTPDSSLTVYSAVTQANTASEITLTATMAATIQTMQTFPNEWVVVLILILLRNLALFA